MNAPSPPDRARSLNRLRFLPDLEPTFQADYYQKSRNTIRAGCVLAAFLMLPTAWYNHSINFTAGVIGNAAVLILCAAYFGLLSSPLGARHWQSAGLVAATIDTAIFHYLNTTALPHLGRIASSGHAINVLLLVLLVLLINVFVVGRFQARYFALYCAATLGIAVVAVLLNTPTSLGLLFAEMAYTALPATLLLLLLAYQQERAARSEFLAYTLLDAERERADALLLNILPASVAARLKAQPGSIADEFSEVGVLFADIVDFTPLASSLPPTELVHLLNAVFTAFDELAERHGMEKIKTVGDAYMAVVGLPEPIENHASHLADMALGMVEVARTFSRADGKPLCVRVGMHIGPVVAGVIGTKRFIYDLWGDTVNIAARMESHGKPDAVQCTEAAYLLLREQYRFDGPTQLSVKGRGTMPVYILLGRNEPALSQAVGGR